MSDTLLESKITAISNLKEYCENEIAYFRDGNGSDHPKHIEIANELSIILEQKIKPYLDSLNVSVS